MFLRQAMVQAGLKVRGNRRNGGSVAAGPWADDPGAERMRRRGDRHDTLPRGGHGGRAHVRVDQPMDMYDA